MFVPPVVNYLQNVETARYAVVPESRMMTENQNSKNDPKRNYL